MFGVKKHLRSRIPGKFTVACQHIKNKFKKAKMIESSRFTFSNLQ
jgi:hypothetical protein